MAKQKGVFELNGTIGGFNFYKRLGVPTVRKSGGGFNGKDIKTKDSMVRVRENGSEFGRLSKAKSLIRQAITPVMGSFTDGTLHARMMTMMHDVKTKDVTSARGERSFWKGLQDAEGQKIFRNFLFTPVQSVETIFGGLPSISAVGVCDFSGLALPNSAFKGSATALMVQYFVVDFLEACTKYKTTRSTPLLIEQTNLPSVIPPLNVANLGTEYNIRMFFLSVQFQQKSGGQFYDLKEQGMLGVRCLGMIGAT